MLLDGLILVEGSTASNLVIASGSNFPSSADLGELFYRSDLSQLSIYNGSTWTNVSSVGGLGTVTSLGISSSDLAVSGSPVTSSGTITLSLNTIPISKGGTGATTTATAINNLLPAQTANSQKFLKTDGTNVSWGVVTTATVYVGTSTGDVSAVEGNAFYADGTGDSAEGLHVYSGGNWIQVTGAGSIPSGLFTADVEGDVTGTIVGGDTATLTLATSGVVAGTYTKVTVDEKGRVTTATTLDAGDIPSLAGTYLTGNETISLSGDATGSGSTSIAVTLANSGAVAGTYTKVTVDAKGRVTTATSLSASDIPSLSSTYQPLDPDLTAIAGLAGTSGALKKTAANTWSLDTSTYLTGNQTVTVSGDASGSGSTAISLTLANSGVAAGTYGTASAVPAVTVDAKGRLTSATATNIAIAASQITSGTLSDARVAASNVTQHQASLTIAETQITDGALLARVGSSETISGTWTFNSPVTVGTPVSGSHAATKDYVDNTITGLDMKASVRVATTGNITLSGTQTIDGVAVVAGNRVLVKDQTVAADNGIYVVAAGSWSRASDADNTPDGEVTSGMYAFVEEGTTNADSGWVLSTNNPISLGITTLSFVQFNGLGQVTAGAGLTKTGNTVNVVSASADRVIVNADSIDLATTGTAGTYAKVTTDAYGRVVSGGALSAGDIPSLSSTYQPLDADLTAIAGLAGTSGLLKKTGGDSWSLDTSTYLTGNESISVSGDATGSGSTSIALTLANSGVVAGSYTKVTVDAKGRVTTATSITAGDIPSLASTYVLKAGDTVTGTLTGTNFHAGAGTTSSPSISFSADTNTGIYSPSADSIAFVEGGAEVMRIDSTGNMGIGTVSPTPGYKLHVAGSITATSIAIGSAVSVGPTGSYILQNAWTTSSGNLILKNGTDFGKGNEFQLGYFPSPNDGSEAWLMLYGSATATLHMAVTDGNMMVGTTAHGGNRLTVSGTATTTALRIGSGSASSPSLSFLDDFATGIFKPTATTLGFSTNGGERMRISTSGNLALGTTLTETFLTEFSASSQGLTLASGLPTIALVDTEDSANYRSWIANVSGSLYISNKSSTGTFVINNAGSERMRITSAGNVGIGTAAPTQRLHVIGTATMSAISVGYGANPSPGIASFTFGHGPQYNLEMTGTSRISANKSSSTFIVAYSDNGGANASGFGLRNLEDTWMFSPYRGGTGTVRPLRFATNTWGDSTTGVALTIETNSNVGIGTSTVNARLDVYGGDALINGVTVGMGTSARDGNIALGTSALLANTVGTDNTAVGRRTLVTNSGGYRNSAVGSYALEGNTNGYGNSALGYQALLRNSTGDNNTAVGNGALLQNTSAGNNTAVGAIALYENTVGTANVAVGSGALNSNTSGSYLVAVGAEALFSNSIGSYSNAQGYQALYSNTTGSHNNAQGHQALYSNTTGSNNSAVGFRAMFLNTVGSSNVAHGYAALYSNTIGDDNVAVGRTALYSNTSGYRSTAIGVVALYSNTTGIQNVALGYAALYLNTSGAYNNAVGSGALYSNTSGSNNVAHGYQALYLNTSGLNNVAQGYQALYSNTSGSNNAAYGHQALYSNTIGGDNVAIGRRALYSSTSTSFNVAIGRDSLFTNTTGTYNVAVGYYSLSANTSGDSSVAVGHQALVNNTTGNDNVAIGRGALLTNTSSSYNTAIGRDSLLLNNTGTFNTAVGYHSLRANTTGSNCVAVGAYALAFNKTGYGNTAVGANALNVNTTGENNVAVGHLSMYANTTGNYNVAMGRSALYANTSGYENNAIGWATLLANTVGYQNVAVGTRSLNDNTSGYRLTAIGADALVQNTSGHSSVAAGYTSQFNNLTGVENVSMGRGSLYANTSGSWNVAVGQQALFNSSGTNNFSIGAFSGADALLNITTESNQGVIGNNSTTNITAKVAITVPSDIRDKTEIAPVTLGLGFVNSVNPISYRFKKSRDSEEAVGRKILGFSAQELLPLQGDATIIDASDANLLKFNSQDLIAVLFKAVKELSTEIEILKAKIDNKE